MVDASGLKRCSRCKQWKPLDEFNKLSRAKDGRQWNCRACNTAWHVENKAHHNALIMRRNVRIVAELHEKLFEYKLEIGCVDCGERDPTVLEFDHLRDKTALVSKLVKDNATWKRLLEEMEKCDVVCANCHRRRTASRANDHRWKLYLANQQRVAEASMGIDRLAALGDVRARTVGRLRSLGVGRLGLEPRTTTG